MWVNCDSDNSELPAGEVGALAISHDGSYVWALTTGGLARIEVSPISADATAVASQCAEWRWETWPADQSQKGFWENDSGLRLAVDEDPLRQSTTVLLVKRCIEPCADRILKMVLSE